MSRSTAIACVFAIAGALAAWRMATYALEFNNELAIGVPRLAGVAPQIEDPKTPRLARRVFLIVVDGLRLDHANHPAFDELRRRGTGLAAAAPYPSISRPGYITILTGVPPIASGVRVNRVRTPVRLDSIMARAQTGGLRVTTASDIGMVPPLFMGNSDRASGFDYPQVGDVVTPPPGMTWPFDEVRRARSLVELERSLQALAAGNGDFVFVLAGDADRAGHARGADSEMYANATASIDRMLGRVVQTIDLSRDAIVITADHGHTGRGGHGGREPEVRAVPLIFAGAGIVPGSRSPGVMLTDIAPTICALLGLPAPGHAYGRTLVELLELDRADATARSAADGRRLATMREVAPDESGGPAARGLVLVAIFAVAALVAMRAVPGIDVSRRSFVGVLAFAVAIGGLFVICRGQLSPSHVPALYRLQRWMTLFAVVGIGAQVVFAWCVLRRHAERLSAANGIALVGLSLSLVPAFAIRAWFAPPYAEPPEPEWFVAIPGIEIGAAVTSVAVALMLVIELIVVARGKRPA